MTALKIIGHLLLIGLTGGFWLLVMMVWALVAVIKK